MIKGIPGGSVPEDIPGAFRVLQTPLRSNSLLPRENDFHSLLSATQPFLVSSRNVPPATFVGRSD